jgi:hypothetical protein
MWMTSAPRSMSGVLFAAHQGQAELVGAAFEACNSAEKLFIPAHRCVAGAAVLVVVGFVFRASADNIAEVEVLHPGSGDGVVQRFAIEVWRVAGIGSGAGVNQHFDAMLPQQFDEVLGGVGRVADGEEGSQLVSLRVDAICMVLHFAGL